MKGTKEIKASNGRTQELWVGRALMKREGSGVVHGGGGHETTLDGGVKLDPGWGSKTGHTEGGERRQVLPVSSLEPGPSFQEHTQ